MFDESTAVCTRVPQPYPGRTGDRLVLGVLKTSGQLFITTGSCHVHLSLWKDEECLCRESTDWQDACMIKMH